MIYAMTTECKLHTEISHVVTDERAPRPVQVSKSTVILHKGGNRKQKGGRARGGGEEKEGKMISIQTDNSIPSYLRFQFDPCDQ